jgi:superfamily I DNA/RNA helicase
MDFISKQQKDIVESNAKHKLVNGCAGSHKTDTLIKCAIFDLHKNKRPILFLTLVGSVTFEIKTRLEKRLDILIHKQGYSNHYLGYYNGIPVCISNYDAWVHFNLNCIEPNSAHEVGEAYNEKVQLLLEKTRTQNVKCFMKAAAHLPLMIDSEEDKELLEEQCFKYFKTQNATCVGLLILDEAQDLQSSKMEIITNICHTHTELSVYIAGDYIQTIYTEYSLQEHDQQSLNQLSGHSMNTFKKVNPVYFNLNKNMRCPKAHVLLNNYLLHEVQKKYAIPPMQSSNNNLIDKPVLFTHRPTSYNADARTNAEQVTRMIQALMEHDSTISPDDIAIIMPKSKENYTFVQLVQVLQDFYTTKGIHKNSIVHMNTYSDGKHLSLDWDSTQNKTKLLSIHGDKGKGHRVVFFMGLTEKSIPRDIYLFKPSEIIPESLLNVALTRSTQYLFIGFVAKYPSRYLASKKSSLLDFVYPAWEDPDPIIVPQPYKSIILSQYSEKPMWEMDNYLKQKKLIGLKSKIQVKEDISKDFEQTKNLVMYKWKEQKRKTQFGKIQTINTPLQEQHFILIGIMSELLIHRILDRKNLFDLLYQVSHSNKTIYTDDERFLTFMYDVKHINSQENFKIFVSRYKKFLDNHPNLENKITEAFQNNNSVVHSVFGKEKFKKNLEEFMSHKQNSELSVDCVWHVTLFWNQINQIWYKPAVNYLFDFLSGEDISTLHTNIAAYVDKYLQNGALIFEGNLSIDANFSKQELNLLNEEYHAISIKGRFDFFERLQQQLIEVKASVLSDCPQEWITQCLTYALLMDVYGQKVKKMSVVNMLKGCLWEWQLPELPYLENVVETKLKSRYQLHDIEVKSLVRSIKTRRLLPPL